MAPKKSNRELRHGTQRFLAGMDVIARIFTAAIKWGALLGIMYFVFRAVASLSGQITMANFAVQFLGNIAINHWLYLLLTGGNRRLGGQ